MWTIRFYAKLGLGFTARFSVRLLKNTQIRILIDPKIFQHGWTAIAAYGPFDLGK